MGKLATEDIKQEMVPLHDMEPDDDETIIGEEEEEGENFHFGADEAVAYSTNFDTFSDYSEGSSRGLPLSVSRQTGGSSSAALKMDGTRSGSESGRFECALCFRRYKSAGSLQNHRSIYHRNEIGKHQKPFLGGGGGGAGLEAGHLDFPIPGEWK